MWLLSQPYNEGAVVIRLNQFKMYVHKLLYTQTCFQKESEATAMQRVLQLLLNMAASPQPQGYTTPETQLDPTDQLGT